MGCDQERSVAEQELTRGHRSSGDQGPAPGGGHDHSPWQTLTMSPVVGEMVSTAEHMGTMVTGDNIVRGET